MPAVNLSKQLLFLLSIPKADEDGEKKTAWDDPEVRERLGIFDHPQAVVKQLATGTGTSPSSSIPPPAPLSKQEWTALAVLIRTLTTRASLDATRSLILQKGGDGEAGIQAFSKLFNRVLGKKANAIVDRELRDHGRHPVQIMRENGDSEWPSAESASHRVAEPVAEALFNRAVFKGSQMVDQASKAVESVVVLNYERIRKQWVRFAKVLQPLKVKAQELMAGRPPPQTTSSSSS